MAQRLRCFICNIQQNRRQMPHLGHDKDKQQIAIFRRIANNLPDDIIDNETRVCFNFNQSLDNEIQLMRNDPTCLRLNVINQYRNRACIICRRIDDAIKISVDCRVCVFVQSNIFIPEIVRCCARHCDQNGLIFSGLLPGLRFTNRPYIIPGAQLHIFLENLRLQARSEKRLENALDNLGDSEFECMFSLTKQQFHELYEFCVVRNNVNRKINHTDLIYFLMQNETRIIR